jgi:hypothetical protein
MANFKYCIDGVEFYAPIELQSVLKDVSRQSNKIQITTFDCDDTEFSIFNGKLRRDSDGKEVPFIDSEVKLWKGVKYYRHSKWGLRVDNSDSPVAIVPECCAGFSFHANDSIDKFTEKDKDEITKWLSDRPSDSESTMMQTNSGIILKIWVYSDREKFEYHYQPAELLQKIITVKEWKSLKVV